MRARESDGEREEGKSSEQASERVNEQTRGITSTRTSEQARCAHEKNLSAKADRATSERTNERNKQRARNNYFFNAKERAAGKRDARTYENLSAKADRASEGE